MPDSPFHILAKPIGPICNLDCHYCYYLRTEDQYGRGTKWQMSDAGLESFVRQYIESQPLAARDVEFVWQGGEPTLLGIDFFRRALMQQRKYVRPGMTVRNCLQTNGVLLDKEWCQFLRENSFLVGLSLDGPPELHDAFRVDHQGKGSHSSVLRALRQLQAEHVEFNILVCVHRANGDFGSKVYHYLKDLGCRYMQFIPIVERRSSARFSEQNQDVAVDPGHSILDAAEAVSSRSVLPLQFGKFLVSVFDEWLREDVGRVFVQIFDESLSMWMGMDSSLCIFKKECGSSLVVEHNGDVYSCDHFVRPDFFLGNLQSASLNQLVDSPSQAAFGRAKERALPQYCRSCEVRFACNGECPKNRFLRTPSGEEGLNFLCEGYRLFFNHIDPAMRTMAHAIRSRTTRVS